MLNKPMLSTRSNVSLDYETELEVNSLITEAARKFGIRYVWKPEEGYQNKRTMHFVLVIELGNSDNSFVSEASNEAFYETLTTEDSDKRKASKRLRTIREKFASLGIEVSLNGGPYTQVVPVYENTQQSDQGDVVITGKLRAINIFRALIIEKCSSNALALKGKKVVEVLFPEEIMEIITNKIPKGFFEINATLSEFDPKKYPPTLTNNDTKKVLLTALRFLVSVLKSLPDELSEEEVQELQEIQKELLPYE
jgi:hypothetical protein